MSLDFKNEQKELYQPKTTPSMVNVPPMVFIAIDGKGNPNNSEEYAIAIEILYGLSYKIKMGNKDVLEYVVAPLEGLWGVDEKQEGHLIIDKDMFYWTVLIRQPDFVDATVFRIAQTALSKKKPSLDTSKARLIRITEGLCVQAMHIGPYDNERVTITVMEQYAVAQGYVFDLNSARRHHEIYLSDPRKISPDKLKTIIRYPIRRK